MRVAGADHGGGEHAGVLQPFARLFRSQPFVLADFDNRRDVAVQFRSLQNVDDFNAVERDAVFLCELADFIFAADEHGAGIAEFHKLFGGFEVSGVVAFGQTDFAVQGFRLCADFVKYAFHDTFLHFLISVLRRGNSPPAVKNSSP